MNMNDMSFFGGSGNNIKIKTINGQSILGSGNLVIEGGAEVPENVETTDNKVMEINENSTDTQYPSAKAVYKAIDEALEGFEGGGSSGGGLNSTAINLLIQILQTAIYSTNISGKIEELKEALVSGGGDEPVNPDKPTVTDDITVVDGIMTIVSVGSEISVTDGIMTIL